VSSSWACCGKDARCCQIEGAPGELRLSVPFGYTWHREAGLGLDPDIRLQEVIRLIFARFSELGSARQVLLSMRLIRSTSHGLPTKAA